MRLHYNGGNPEGIFFCRIRVSATELQILYVGVYPSVTDNNGAGANGDGKSQKSFTLWYKTNKYQTPPLGQSNEQLK